MKDPKDCDGTWNEVPYWGEAFPQVIGPGADEVATARCSGCGDWMVIIRNDGYDVPASVARTQEQAVADVHFRLTMEAML